MNKFEPRLYVKGKSVKYPLPLRRLELTKYLKIRKNLQGEKPNRTWDFIFTRARRLLILNYWRRWKRKLHNYKRMLKQGWRLRLKENKRRYVRVRYRKRFPKIYRFRKPRRNKTTKPGPRSVLRKKTFFRPIHNKGRKGFNQEILPYVIRTTESALFTPKEIEVSRLVFSRPLKRAHKAKYKIGLFPYVSMTKKPLQARMGKGKGKPSGFIAPARVGEIIFELNRSLRLNTVKKLHKKATFKLPVFTKLLFKTRNQKHITAKQKYAKVYNFPNIYKT